MKFKILAHKQLYIQIEQFQILVKISYFEGNSGNALFESPMAEVIKIQNPQSVQYQIRIFLRF